MPYMELLSLVGGSLTGFIFKMMAQRQADEREKFDMMMKAIQASDTSADNAAKRVPNDKAGNWIRRVIVLSVLFGVILAPFVLSLVDKSTVVQVQEPVRHFLGIIPYGGHDKFYEIKGYLMVPEIRTALLAILGFYFGQSAAKR